MINILFECPLFFNINSKIRSVMVKFNVMTKVTRVPDVKNLCRRFLILLDFILLEELFSIMCCKVSSVSIISELSF